jgi:hypothetical protein
VVILRRLYLFFSFAILFSSPKGTGQSLPIDQIKRTVVYLQGSYACRVTRKANGVPVLGQDGNPILDESQCHQSGTGFFIGIPTPEVKPDLNIALLATSKHLLQHPRLDGPQNSNEYFDNLTGTMNTILPADGGSYIAPFPIQVKVRGFLECMVDTQDPEADVAICPIAFSDKVFDFTTVGEGMFVTQSTIQTVKLNETDEVLFAGLFTPYAGVGKNYPIVRHGKVALMPHEKIPWNNAAGGHSLQDLFLAEITSLGGNSGSPVFVRLNGLRDTGDLSIASRYLLLEVMQGYFNSERPIALDTGQSTDTAHVEGNLLDNSGVAAIAPAEKIIEILAQPKAKAYISLVKAEAYSAANKPAEAEFSYKEAIDAFRKLDPEHPMLEEALTSYASFLQNAGRLPEANFQKRMAKSMTKVSHAPDDQLW